MCVRSTLPFRVLGLACVVVLMLAAEAYPQWDRFVPLTFDSFGYGQPRMVVDDSLRLHVFCYRNLRLSGAQPGCLTYLRYDSWGNLLSGPTPLFSDSQLMDQPAAVWIDNDGDIRVIWERDYYHPSYGRMLYMRMSSDGEVLEGPWEIEQQEAIPVGGHDPNVVQTTDGRIYYTDGERMACFSEAMEIIHPIEWIVAPVISTAAKLSVTPDNQVWIAYRYTRPGECESVRVQRIDTIGLDPIVVTAGDTLHDQQVGLFSFLIDTDGVFHYVLYRDDSGVFYQRDPRDGSTPDTMILYTEGWLAGRTPLTPVGQDTLMLILQGDRTIRYTLTPDGNLLSDPMEIHPAGQFCLDLSSPYIWKDGSHWVLGFGWRPTSTWSHLVMIHVPGPNEPPNSLTNEERGACIKSNLIVYPNPFNTNVTIMVDLPSGGEYSLECFDITGRWIASLARKKGTVGRYKYFFNAGGMPSGVYFFRFQAPHTTLTQKAVLVK